MHVSISRLRVDTDAAGRLVAAFRQRAHLVDADGFVDLQVWPSDRDAGEILIVSRWRELERLEHLRTYEVVAS